ncbi:MAG: dihydropteroate synthase [Campylobacterota bacterium]
MQVKQLLNPQDSKQVATLLKDIDVDSRGCAIMAQKAKIYLFHIKGIRCGAANILKQDALSVGADFALPYGTIECKNKKDEGILIASRRTLLRLSAKLRAQPFGLKTLAKELEGFTTQNRHELKVMGVVNANDDSFYEKSRFNGTKAVAHIQKLIEEGADIIDLGGVSSKPGSIYCGVEEELRRVTPILEQIKCLKLYEKVDFSIDSFAPQVVTQALESGFSIINDITGLRDTTLAKLAKNYEAKLCIMHMQNDPQNMQKNPTYEDVTLEVDSFFRQRIDLALECGLQKQQLILDVGIGFGKTLTHNLELLKNLSHFQHFGCELLIGASRKSMINSIFASQTTDRLAGTLALHLQAHQNGASIIRAHDVYEHVQAFAVQKALME